MVFLVGVVGNISACHADARGSIPRRGAFWYLPEGSVYQSDLQLLELFRSVFHLLTCLELYEGVQSQPDSLLESRKAWHKGIARAPSYVFYCVKKSGFDPIMRSRLSWGGVEPSLVGFRSLAGGPGFDPSLPGSTLPVLKAT